MKNKTGYYSCNCNNQQQQKICCSCLHYYWPSLYWSKRIMQPRPNKYETAAGDEPDDQGRRRVPRDVAHHPRSCQHQRRTVPPHRLLLGCHQEQHLQHRGRHHWPYVVLSLAITCLIAKKIIVLYCFHVFQLSFLIAKSIGIYVCISTIFWIIWLTHDAWMQKTSWPGSRSSLTVGDQS